MSLFHNDLFKNSMRVMSLLLALVTTLGGCGGISGDSNPPAQVSTTVSSSQPKVLRFSWGDVGADHYKLLKNPDGSSGYSQVGANITTTSVEETIGAHLQDWVNASYIVQSCNALGACTDSAAITATTAMLNANEKDFSICPNCLLSTCNRLPATSACRKWGQRTVALSRYEVLQSNKHTNWCTLFRGLVLQGLNV